MNSIENMNSADSNPAFQPANVPMPVHLAVYFAADFPVEFTIQRLEDVPLSAPSQGQEPLQAARRQS